MKYKNRLSDQKGMSLIEAAIVIFLIIGMCLASIPLFHHFSQKRVLREFNHVKDSVISGVAAWHTSQMMKEDRDVFPLTLDDNPSPSSCVQCFNSVLTNGLKNEKWSKKSLLEYTFGDYGFRYSPSNGSIKVF